MAEDVVVKLSDVRSSYLHVFVPQKKDEKSEPRYSANFLIPKNTPEGRAMIDSLKKAMQTARLAKWGNNQPKLAADKLCLKDGDNSEVVADKDAQVYAGHVYVSAARAINQPKMAIRDRNKRELTQADGKPYSGCFVNAWVRIWAQDNQYGKRINAVIEGVQFVRDGEAFGARPLSEDVFDNLDGDNGMDFDNKAGLASGASKLNGHATEEFADF